MIIILLFLVLYYQCLDACIVRSFMSSSELWQFMQEPAGLKGGQVLTQCFSQLAQIGLSSEAPANNTIPVPERKPEKRQPPLPVYHSPQIMCETHERACHSNSKAQRPRQKTE